ncbi:MAG: biotin/lipoyl-binding protein [Chthoniobacteraceae bacterium]
MAGGTFSEHWHRVAGRRVGLRAATQTRRQFFRSEKWFLVIDPLNNQFFRITPAAHDFLCHLSRGATVQEVWEQCLARDPDGAPGQEEVIRLLAQLHQANLLCGDVPAEPGVLLERHTKRRSSEVRSMVNLMSLRIATFDPDRFLQRALPAVRWLMSPLGAVLWLAVIGGAIKVALDHADALRTQSEGVLAPANLPLLYLGMLFIKGLHELGHGFACRRFGGEVHQMGVMLLYFSPVPFVNATASWGFRSKWQRIFVASAGMIVEFFVAALAMFVWAATGEGALHSFAYNTIFVASVTTLLFNANPLMRYDGYYIFSDLLEVPNLAMRSMQMLQYLAERHLFGIPGLESPAHGGWEAVLLTLYGVASWIYRIFVFIGIALWISGRWMILGILLGLSCVFSFTVLPLWKIGQYLAASPRLIRQRRRAVLITCGTAAVVLAVLAWWPMPSRFRAPGVVQAEEYSKIFTNTAGVVTELLARSGDAVAQGQPLLRLESRELELELAAAIAELARATAEEERALNRNAAEIGPIRNRRTVEEKHVLRIKEQQRGLVVVASHAGTWVCPQLEQSVGQWFPRGQVIGEIVQDADFRFTAVISQQEAANLFTGEVRSSQVRIRGEADKSISVQSVRVIPAEQRTLPSAALGWAAGGDIATAQGDPHGKRAVESFFELRATLAPAGGVRLLHGRSGKIRVELGNEPLLAQWYRKLRQMLQKRYQV